MDTLPLANKDYWDNPGLKVDQYTNKLLSDGKEKIVIGTPDNIFMDTGKELRVVMAGVRNQSFEWKYDFKNGTKAVCCNTNNGKIYVGNVFRPADRKQVLKPSNGFIANDYIIDLRTALGIPWEPGEYKIWFVYFDILSNSTTCKLSVNENVCNSAEEQKYFDDVSKNSQRREMILSDSIQYHHPVNYDVNTGIAIEYNPTKDGKYIFTIHGKLPVVAYQQVPDEERSNLLKNVYAVFSMDILIVRTSGEYQIVTLGVPCYSEIIKEDDIAIGLFGLTLDVEKILKSEIEKEEEVYLYVFSNGFAARPVLMDTDGFMTDERAALKKSKKCPKPTPILR